MASSDGKTWAGTHTVPAKHLIYQGECRYTDSPVACFLFKRPLYKPCLPARHRQERSGLVDGVVSGTRSHPLRLRKPFK